MDRIVSEFMELVQIDAASRKERGVADVVKAKLEALGFTVEEDSVGEALGGDTGNLFAVLEGTADGCLLFSSHLDRVAKGLGIKPRIEGDRIVSDGTTILAADDLSGVAAILEGVRRLRESGDAHPRIEVLFSVCEESGLEGSLHMDYSKVQSKVAFVLDSPGRLGRVINSAPSQAHLSFEVHGKNAHAGNSPELGINAVMAAVKVLAGVPDGRVDPITTANYSVFEASGPTNVVNNYARVKGEARSRDNGKLKDYVDHFLATCERVAAETGATIQPDVQFIYEGFLVPEESVNIQVLKAVFQQMGRELLVEGGGGGMDANRYNAQGIVSVGVATGYSLNHTVNEYIELDDLKVAGEMVERIIREYMKH